MFGRSFSFKATGDASTPPAPARSLLSRAVSSFSMSKSGGGTIEPDATVREESLQNEANILDVGVDKDSSVDIYLMNGIQLDRLEWILLGQENLLTENFTALIETDSIFNALSGSAKGIHAVARSNRHGSVLVLERLLEEPPDGPTVISGFPSTSLMLNSLRGERDDVPLESDVKQLAVQLQSVADLLAGDKALYLQEGEARSGIRFDDRVLDILGASGSILLKCVLKRSESRELNTLSYLLEEEASNSKDTVKQKETEKKRQVLLRRIQNRARMLQHSCNTFGPLSCTILSKLNTSQTLSAGRIREGVLCLICYLGMSGTDGRERLISSGVCELLVQTGKEHSNIEAVVEWACRGMSALCSIGHRMNAGMAGRDGGQIFRSIAASMLAESSTGERGRGRLVELGAVHLLLVRFTAEHVSPWLSKQRKPSGVAVKSASKEAVRRGSRRSSFTGRLMTLLEGSAVIECVCLALHALCFQNGVYKRMVLSSQAQSFGPSQSLLVAEDNIGGLHSLFKWVAHRCAVICSLMDVPARDSSELAGRASDVSDKASKHEDLEEDRYGAIVILPVGAAQIHSAGSSSPRGASGQCTTCPAVCTTMAWIWRLVASLAVYDHSISQHEDTVDNDPAPASTTGFRRRSSVGSVSAALSAPTSFKTMLGNLGACEAVVATLRCCASASVPLTCAGLSAVSAMCRGNKRNQSAFLEFNLCTITVQVLEYHWEAYKERRQTLLQLNDMRIDMEIESGQSSDLITDAEENFEQLLRETCIALHSLCHDSEAGATDLAATPLCSILAAIIQYCFELENGSRPISFIWYLTAGMVMHPALRSCLVGKHNLATFLSMSMKLHGVNDDVAIWLASNAIGVARDCDSALAFGRAGGCGGLAQLMRTHGSSNIAVLMQCSIAVAEMCFSVPITHSAWFGSAGVCEALCTALEDVFVLNLKKYSALFTSDKHSLSPEESAAESCLISAAASHGNPAVNAAVPIPSLEALAEAGSACIAALSAPLGYSEFARRNDNCVKLSSARVLTVLAVFLRPHGSGTGTGPMFVTEISTQHALKAVRNLTQYFVQLFQLYVAPYRPLLGVQYTLMQSVPCGVPRRRAVCLSVGSGGMAEDEEAGAMENICFSATVGGYSVYLNSSQRFRLNSSRGPSSESLSSLSSPKIGKFSKSNSSVSPLNPGHTDVTPGSDRPARPRILSNASIDSTHSGGSRRVGNAIGSMLSPISPALHTPTDSERMASGSISIHLKWCLDLLGHVHTIAPFHAVFGDLSGKSNGVESTERRQIFQNDAESAGVIDSLIESGIPEKSSGMSMAGLGDTILSLVISAIPSCIYDKRLVITGCQAVVLLLHVRCAAVRIQVRERLAKVCGSGMAPSTPSHKRSGSGAGSMAHSPIVAQKAVSELCVSPIDVASVSPAQDHDDIFRRYQFVKEGVIGEAVSSLLYCVLETHMNDKYMVEPLLKLQMYALTLIDADGLCYYLLREGLVPLLVQLLNRHVDSESLVVLITRLINNSISAYSNLYPPHLLYHGSGDRVRDKIVVVPAAGRSGRLKDVYFSGQAIDSGGAGAVALHAELTNQLKVAAAMNTHQVSEPVETAEVASSRHGLLFGIDGYGGKELCEGLVNALLQHPDSADMVRHSFVCIAGAIRPFSAVHPIVAESGDADEKTQRALLNQSLLADLGVCEIVPRLMRAHMTDAAVVAAGSSVISNMCCENSELCSRIVDSSDCVGVLISCLDLHRLHGPAVEWLTRALSMLSMTVNYHCSARLGALGACQAVVSVLAEHFTNAEVALQCVLTLGNLVSYSPSVYLDSLPIFMQTETRRHNAHTLLVETSFLMTAKKVLSTHMDTACVVAACLRAIYFVALYGSRSMMLLARQKGYSVHDRDVVDLSGLQSVAAEGGPAQHENEDCTDDFDIDPDDAFVIPYRFNEDRGHKPSGGFGVDLYALHGLIAEAIRTYSNVRSVTSAGTNGGAGSSNGNAKSDLLVCEWACLLVCLSSNLSNRCRDAYTYFLTGGGEAAEESDCGVIESIIRIVNMTGSIAGHGAATNIGTVGNILSGVWASLTSADDTVCSGIAYVSALSNSTIPVAGAKYDIPFIAMEAYSNPFAACVGCHTGSLVSLSDLPSALCRMVCSSDSDVDRYRFELDFGRLHRALRFACLAIHSLCVRPPTYLSTQLAFNSLCPQITKLLGKWGDKDVALCRAALKAMASMCDVGNTLTRELGAYGPRVAGGTSDDFRQRRSSSNLLSSSHIKDTEPAEDLLLFPLHDASDLAVVTVGHSKVTAERGQDTQMLEFEGNEEDEITQSSSRSGLDSPDWILGDHGDGHNDGELDGSRGYTNDSNDIETQLTSILSKIDGINGPSDSKSAFKPKLYDNSASNDNIYFPEDEDYMMDGASSSNGTNSRMSSVHDQHQLCHAVSADDFLVHGEGDMSNGNDVGSLSALLMMHNGNYGHCVENQDSFGALGAGKLLLHLLHIYTGRQGAKLTVYIFRALESMLSHQHCENAARCTSSDAIGSIIASMQSNLFSRGISSAGCGVLANLMSIPDSQETGGKRGDGSGSTSRRLTYNANVASLLGGQGACEAIIDSIDRYSADVTLCEKAILALSNLSEDVVGMGAWLGHTGACRALLGAMERHPNNAQIMKTGWAAVLNISRDIGCRARFGAAGACELAHRTLCTYHLGIDTGHTATSAASVEIGVMAVRVLCRLCVGVGGNCRRVLADDVFTSLQSCVSNGPIADVLLIECCRLVTIVSHYIRTTRARSAACTRINESIVKPGLIQLLVKSVCQQYAAASVSDEGCAMIAMVAFENPLAQEIMMGATGEEFSGLHSCVDVMLEVLKHHAWMNNVCASCCHAILAVCKGCLKAQAVIGQNGTAALLVGFALEHIESSLTLNAILSTIEVLTSLYINNGVIFRAAGVTPMLIECFSFHIKKKDNTSVISAILSCVKVLLSADVNITHSLLFNTESPPRKTTFLSLLVKAMTIYIHKDEVCLLGCGVITLLCYYDNSEDDVLLNGVMPSVSVSNATTAIDVANECAAAGVPELLKAILDMHNSALGHAYYIDQQKRFQAERFSHRFGDTVSSQSGMYVSFDEDADGEGKSSSVGGVYSGINYDLPVNAPEDDVYDSLFVSECPVELSSIYLPVDGGVFYYAAMHSVSTLDAKCTSYVSIADASVVSDSSEEQGRYVSPEKAAAQTEQTTMEVLLPIDIMIVRAVCCALCQLCSEHPKIAVKCLSIGMVKAINASVTALFISSSLCPATECIMAKDVILAAINEGEAEISDTRTS